MSLMKCDLCPHIVDTDEYPESMYVTEDYGLRKPNGQEFVCLCGDCCENQVQIYENRRSGK